MLLMKRKRKKQKKSNLRLLLVLLILVFSVINAKLEITVWCEEKMKKASITNKIVVHYAKLGFKYRFKENMKKVGRFINPFD